VEKGFIVFERTFQPTDEIRLSFKTEVKVLKDEKGEKYFSYGALIFAKPINATEQKGRIYEKGFEDLFYQPKDSVRYGFFENNDARYQGGKIFVNLRNLNTQTIDKMELIPFGKTILRQASFQ
jgi:uncharacterized protein